MGIFLNIQNQSAMGNVIQLNKKDKPKEKDKKKICTCTMDEHRKISFFVGKVRPMCLFSV